MKDGPSEWPSAHSSSLSCKLSSHHQRLLSIRLTIRRVFMYDTSLFMQVLGQVR